MMERWVFTSTDLGSSYAISVAKFCMLFDKITYVLPSYMKTFNKFDVKLNSTPFNFVLLHFEDRITISIKRLINSFIIMLLEITKSRNQNEWLYFSWSNFPNKGFLNSFRIPTNLPLRTRDYISCLGVIIDEPLRPHDWVMSWFEHVSMVYPPDLSHVKTSRQNQIGLNIVISMYYNILLCFFYFK